MSGIERSYCQPVSYSKLWIIRARLRMYFLYRQGRFKRIHLIPKYFSFPIFFIISEDETIMTVQTDQAEEVFVIQITLHFFD